MICTAPCRPCQMLGHHCGLEAPGEFRESIKMAGVRFGIGRQRERNAVQ